MRSPSRIIATLALLAAPGTAIAGRPIVAVFDIQARRAQLDREALGALSDYLANQLTASGAYQVVPRDQLKQRLTRQQTRSYRQCYAQSCQIEIGKELAAQKSLASKVMKIGSKCVVIATLYDLRRATTEQGANAKGSCSEDGIMASIKAVVIKLAAGMPRSPAPSAPDPAPSATTPAPSAPAPAPAPSAPTPSATTPSATTPSATTPSTPTPVRGQAPSPSVTWEAFQLHRLPAPLTDQAVATIKRLLNTTPSSDPDRPDVMMRLADEYRRRAIVAAVRAQQAARLAGAPGHPQAARLRQTREEHFKLAKRWTTSALRHYLPIVNMPAFSRYKRLDAALYYTGAMLHTVRRHKRAASFFRKLVLTFPQSLYIPEALVSLAEHRRSEGKLDSALELYTRAAKFPGVPIHGFAVYMQGTCYVGLADHRRALEKYVKVIRGRGRWRLTRQGRETLVRGALRDSVLAYSHVGTPREALLFYRRVGGTHAAVMVERLARIYLDQGKQRKAGACLSTLLGRFPRHARSGAWRALRTRARSRGGR